MKHILTLILAAVTLAVTSCSFLTSAAGIAAVENIAVPLATIGLQAAVDKGKLSTGDAVTLQRGLAVVTNQNDSTTVKVFNLAELGLQAAVSKGLVKPGDSVLIQNAAAVIQRAVVTPQTGASKNPVASVKP